MTEPATQAALSKAYGLNPAEPVECYYAPLLYPTIEGDKRRAGHYYRRTTKGHWLCINCGEPRP